MFYGYKTTDFNLVFDNNDDFTQCTKAIIDTVDKLISEEIKNGNTDKYQLFTYLQEIIDNKLIKDSDRELKITIEKYVEYLFGFEIEEKTAQKRNIVILHKEEKKLAAIKIIALDLLTGTIITLINSIDDQEGEIKNPSKIFKNIKPLDVIKIQLKKVKHNNIANTYLISDNKEIEQLGDVKPLMLLCYKLVRHDKKQNIFYHRKDADNKKDAIYWVSDDKDAVSSFDKVLNYSFKNGCKFIKYFLVKFTKTRVEPYKNKYQIKMLDNFVNIEMQGMKNNVGKYYKGLALLRSHRLADGKFIYFADQLFGQFLNEKEFDRRGSLEKELTNKDWYLDEMGEIEPQLNELEGIIEDKLTDKDWYLGEIDDIERQLEEAESIEEANELRTTLKNMEDELDSLWLDVPEKDECLDDYNELYARHEKEFVNNTMVYEISDLSDDYFALNFKTIKYSEYIKNNKLEHILSLDPPFIKDESDFYEDDNPF